MTQCICSHLERDHFRGGACRECGCLIWDPWDGELPETERARRATNEPDLSHVVSDIAAQLIPPEPRAGEWWENA